MVDLCLRKAAREDPQKLALRDYTRGRNLPCSETLSAEKRRHDCYIIIINALDKFEEQFKTSPLDAAEKLKMTVNAVLQNTDRLAHAAVLHWLMRKKRTNMIMQSTSPYIEFFLVQEINAGRGQKCFDLLWRMNQRTGNYLEAARIFDKLAGDIVDKKNIQMKVKEALSDLGNEELLAELDCSILSLRELLLRFVIPFNMLEILLQMFYESGFYISEELITNIWADIIRNETRISNNNYRMLAETMRKLFEQFGNTHFFPKKCILLCFLTMEMGRTPMIIFEHILPAIQVTEHELMGINNERFPDKSFAKLEHSKKLHICELMNSLSDSTIKKCQQQQSIYRFRRTCSDSLKFGTWILYIMGCIFIASMNDGIIITSSALSNGTSNGTINATLLQVFEQINHHTIGMSTVMIQLTTIFIPTNAIYFFQAVFELYKFYYLMPLKIPYDNLYFASIKTFCYLSNIVCDVVSVSIVHFEFGAPLYAGMLSCFAGRMLSVFITYIFKMEAWLTEFAVLSLVIASLIIIAVSQECWQYFIKRPNGILYCRIKKSDT
ncbi:hypothetical protein L3Y34_005763 [Caenorhabditis briggsae]|uniref:Nucleoporin Nup133/Nup155-like C-terminal domain-containing protein n=1 Tax=Caenorhabditis briggsae TaxID=6238 RepID=A0AAE9IKW7_CAEBR|nr:hypothetical protein L3Y34_005763 [Caenorhabditis briggsae]